MKKILLSLVALICATVSFAQTSLLATLSHNGTISTFYGTTALKEALEKADNGDAITLSAGRFHAVNITKAITLRGAGMNVRNDSINSHESSIVQGECVIEIPDSVETRLVIEGIYFSSRIDIVGTVKNSLFMKSRFQRFSHKNNTDRMINGSFIHCRFADSFWLPENSNACLVNCVVYIPVNHGTNASNFEFDNCIVSWINSWKGYYSHYAYEAYDCNSVENSTFKNCIILSEEARSLPSSNVAYYSLGINNYYSGVNMFQNIVGKNTTNTFVFAPGGADIFLSSSYSYADAQMYELTDKAKTNYLGTDGKEVGIYGGNLPYEEDPTTPQITKCNVAAKSTADGKLSVDIEVKAAEY